MHASPPDPQIHIAAVISPHGFGHAARACAVLESLRAQRSDLHFEIFTEIPEWFFEDTLGLGFTIHPLTVDVGLVQRTPFEEDLPKTLARLMDLLSAETDRAERLADLFRNTKCRLALCDIAPLGILAASRVGIPALLVENFTWDWIYEGYFELDPGFAEVSNQLRKNFAAASAHIQAEPICKPERCDLVSRPVARKPRQSREEVRKRLGVPARNRLVLVTVGGIEQTYPGISVLETTPAGISFVIPGSAKKMEKFGSVILLPHHSEFFHPDLVYASDAVVGKLGYSTISEAYRAGIPFAYVPRDSFRETGPLASFTRNNLSGVEVDLQEFINGGWVKTLPFLLEQHRQERSCPNGADEIAQFLLQSGWI